MRVALVACVKSKLAQPAAAAQLYTSALFKASIRYAQTHADKWYVLSAKHGLLRPDQVIAPYDVTLKTMPRSEQRRWATRVTRQLVQEIPPGSEVLILAGQAYRQHIVRFLEERGHKLSIPLAGKRFGEQLKELSSPQVEPAARRDLERFYAIFRRLASLPGQGAALGECNGKLPWPERGVYFFVEPGEYRQGGEELRIVRVGTHAVSAGSTTTLWQRLRAHRGASNGNGNHRGSVFRRHVGVALLAKATPSERALAASWGLGQNAPKAAKLREAELEARVSAYLARARVFWLDVPDEAGRGSQRSYIERNAVALLSNGGEPFDPPSASWLGRFSDREPIRQSGLWNVDFVGQAYDRGFVAAFEELVQRMSAMGSQSMRPNPPKTKREMGV